MSEPDHSRPPWLVRIFGPAGPVGAGCVLDSEHVVTCAHVVSAAKSAHHGDDGIDLDFPFVDHGQRINATVVLDGWNRPAEGSFAPFDSAGKQDLAILHLPGGVPHGAHAPPFSAMPDRSHRFEVYGFPVNHDDGVWANGSIIGPAGSGWLQLQTEAYGYRVSKGFSGSPVWDRDNSRVIGIMVAAERDTGVLASFCIPVKTIAGLWPPLEQEVRQSPAEPLDESGLYLFGLNVNGRQHGISWSTTNLVDVWLRGKGVESVALTEIEIEHGGADGYGGATGVLPVEAEYSFPFESGKRRRHALEPPLMIYPEDREAIRFQLALYPSGNFPEFGGTVSATVLYDVGTGEIGELPLTRVPAGWKLLSRATRLPIPLRFPRVLGTCEVTPGGALRGTLPARSWESVPSLSDFDEDWLARPGYEAMLTNALLDADAETRIFALRALGKLGGYNSWEAIKRCLSDEDQGVRKAAILAMLAINPAWSMDEVLARPVPLVASPLEGTGGLQ